MSSYYSTGKLRYEYEEDTGNLAPCPGIYCGRTLFENGSYSNCGPCPRGTKRDETYACVKCDKDLPLYDLLYLGFMTLLPIVLHFLASDPKRLKTTKHTLGHVICTLSEVLLSSLVTLFIFSESPFWNFSIKSCGVEHLSDWYPFVFNPQPNYEKTLHCSHEAVYPLYTMILIFYTLADLFMIIIRLIAYFFGVRLMRTVYAGLYFYPILAFSHLIFCGIIYRVFPSLLLTLSLVSIAYHFAQRRNQKMRQLLIESVTDWRNCGIVLCHWFLHSYGIISITQFENLPRDSSLLALVPLPSLLYILTVPFTNPNNNINGA